MATHFARGILSTGEPLSTRLSAACHQSARLLPTYRQARFCASRSLLAELLFEHATDISIFFGQAINQGNDDAAIDMVAKHTLMEKLTKSLTEMGKNVKISLC